MSAGSKPTVGSNEKVYRAVIRVLVDELLSGELIKGDSKWARPIADKVMAEIEKGSVTQW